MTSSNKQHNQQVLQTGNIKAHGNVSINQTMSSEGDSFVGDEKRRQEFVKNLAQAIGELEKHKNKSEKVVEALNELKSAKTESEKKEPEPSIISRFLRSAKGIVEEVVGTVTGISTVATTITSLIKILPEIFK